LTSEPQLFAGTYARGRVADVFTASSWLQAMLDAEAALARACAAEGFMPASAAEAIAAVCDARRFDVSAIALEAGAHATPVLPLVSLLRAQVTAEVAEYVHLGATSQDILDTAAMLLTRRGLDAILDDGDSVLRGCAELARKHRDTPMCGRTLLQQALPTSFGLRAAGWMVGVREALAAVRDVRARQLAVQMGGPVGARSPAIARRVAAELQLAEPALPWQAVRVRVGALAGALGVLCGVLAKLARDVTLLAQNEVGEVSEGGGGGGSSAMSHKHNPVAAVSVLACAKRVPGLVATLLAAMEQEHERAAGGWQAEWGTLAELVTLTGSATSWSAHLVEHLQVDATRMRENLKRLTDIGAQGDLAAASELIERALDTEDSP
jgi:3-carboxy-cis,cis-muconate cycloisomerase